MTANAAVAEAIRRLAGSERTLVYDVPSQERPVRTGPTSPFVVGGESWWRFVRRRTGLDNGLPTILISLRRLPEDEALLAVDWGTMFANAILLVEPLDAIDPSSVVGRASPAEVEAWLRERLGVWHYWRLTSAGQREPRDEPFRLEEGQHLTDVLENRLPRVFPLEAFRASLMALNTREADLFVGRPVARVILPFLTRLGLPVPYAPGLLIEAVRDLVNLGLAYVQDDKEEDTVYHGPERPLPQSLSLERLACMIRV